MYMLGAMGIEIGKQVPDSSYVERNSSTQYSDVQCKTSKHIGENVV